MGAFFRTSGSDFCWLLLEPINVASSKAEEPALAKRLSPGQKALYFWWYLDAQVTNGGFVQFYYNGYAVYVPAIIKGLAHIGDTAMKQVVEQAHGIYLREEKVFRKAREKGEFGSDLYDRLGELSELDESYYEINELTYSNFEKFARQYPGEFCVNEDGKQFDRSISGRQKTFFEGGGLKEEFELIDGAIEGEVKTYYPSGQLASVHTYTSGRSNGKQSEWYANGVLKLTVQLDSTTYGQRREEYDKSGQRVKLEHIGADGERYGEYKEWYPSGALKEQGTYTSNDTRVGPWLEYWEDGSKKLEAEFKAEGFVVHQFWDASGKQLLTNGTGLYVNEFEMDMPSRKVMYRYETQYRNYRKHGLSSSYRDGVLSLTQEFQDGVADGFVRSYNDRGELAEEKLYKNGELISTKTFRTR